MLSLMSVTMRKLLHLLLCLSLAVLPLRTVLAMPSGVSDGASHDSVVESHCASADEAVVDEAAVTRADCCSSCEQGCADGHCNNCLQAGTGLLVDIRAMDEPPAALPVHDLAGPTPGGIYSPPFRPPVTPLI